MRSLDGYHIRGIYRRVAALLLTLALLLPLWGIAPAQAAANGVVRVKLTRIGGHSAITFKADCDCVLEGKLSINIPSGSEIRAEVSGGALTITSGGVRIGCGQNARILRCSEDGVFSFTLPAIANRFQGDLTLSAAGSAVEAVLGIYIEDYLCGVVGWEMSNSYPLEALKAQTVAARNYVLKKKTARAGKSYDVTDTTSDQVFRGLDSRQTRVIQAVQATAGRALYAGNALASCYYGDSNGGQTESTRNVWGSKLSYSVVKDDPYDLENAKSQVKTARICRDASDLNASLQAALVSGAAASLGVQEVKIVSIDEIEPCNPKYEAPSRLYRTLRFEITVQADDATRAAAVDVPTYGGIESWYGLSINSGDNETVAVDQDANAFYVRFRRSGHGVGMSQRGAQRMAADCGMSFEQILEFYYPGTELRKLSLSRDSAAQKLTASDGAGERRTAKQEIPVYDRAGGTEACAWLQTGTEYAVYEAQGSRVKVGVRGMAGWIDADVPTVQPSEEATAAPDTEPTAEPTVEPTPTPGVVFLPDSPSWTPEPTFAPAATSEPDDGDVWMPDGDTKIDDGGDVWMPDGDTKIDDGGDVWMPDGDTKIDDGGDISLPDDSTAGGLTPADPDANMKQVSGKKYVYVNVSVGSTLTLRAAPDADAFARGSLARGTKLRLLAYDDEWARVLTESGAEGYAARRYLSINAPETAATARPDRDSDFWTADDNEATDSGSIYRDLERADGEIVVCNRRAKLRRAATLYKKNSTSSAVVAALPSGARVTVSAYNERWAYISWNGKKGFVMLEYLKAE